MRVRRINLESKTDIEQFITFPFWLYRQCPLWVPPLMSASRHCLNIHKHPFYRHSEAAFFVAEGTGLGDVVGRIAVMNNRNYNRHRGTGAAFFGFFDTVNDQRVSRLLFQEASVWARREGLTEIIGPCGLSGGDGGGILVEGFDERPVMGIPYNFEYYDSLLQGAGFTKDSDYLSGYLNRSDSLDERYYRVAEKVKARRGFHIKSFRSKGELRRWTARIVEAHSKAFCNNYTYYPPTEEEVALLLETIFTVVDPKLVKLALKGDQVIGFLVVLPDLSVALRKAKGRLWSWGWRHLLAEKRRARVITANLLGVLPQYQGWGVIAVLYIELAALFFRHGYERLEVVTVKEGNQKTVAEHDKLGTRWYKRHRVYRRDLLSCEGGSFR